MMRKGRWKSFHFHCSLHYPPLVYDNLTVPNRRLTKTVLVWICNHGNVANETELSYDGGRKKLQYSLNCATTPTAYDNKFNTEIAGTFPR